MNGMNCTNICIQYSDQFSIAKMISDYIPLVTGNSASSWSTLNWKNGWLNPWFRNDGRDRKLPLFMIIEMILIIFAFIRDLLPIFLPYQCHVQVSNVILLAPTRLTIKPLKKLIALFLLSSNYIIFYRSSVSALRAVDPLPMGCHTISVRAAIQAQHSMLTKRPDQAFFSFCLVVLVA